MHETAIAQSIVETVLSEAAKAGARTVEAVDIHIGELTFLGIDQIRFWIDNQIEGTVAQEAEWRFTLIPGALACHACGHKGPLEAVDTDDHFSIPVYACPQCQSHDLEITQGRDAYINAIHVEVDEEG